MVQCTWDRTNGQVAEQTAHPSAVRAGGRVLSSNGCTQIDEEPNFGTPDQRALGRVTVDEAKRYLAEGHFGAGSMAPKIQAIIRFLESGGRRAIVTCPPDLEDAVAGNAGTEFVAR